MEQKEGNRQPGTWVKQIAVAAVATLICFAIAYKLYGFPFLNKAYYWTSLHPFKGTKVAGVRRESFLPSFLAYLLHVNKTEELFTSFFVTLYWVGIFILTLIQERRFGTKYALVWPPFFLSFPTTMIIHCWNEPPDSLSFLLTLSLFYSTSSLWVFTAGMLGALNHTFEWMIIAPSLLLLRRTAKSRRLILTVVAGILLGFVTLKTIFWLRQISFAESRFGLVMSKHFFTMVSTIWNRAPFRTLYSLYFAHWLLIPVMITRLYRRDKTAASIFICIQAVSAVVALYVLETTRDFTFLTWGSFFFVLQDQLRHEESSGGHSRFSLRWLLYATILFSLLLPKGFSRSGAWNPV